MTVRVMCDYDDCGSAVIADGRTGDWLLDQGDGFDYCPTHAKTVIYVRIERERHPDARVGPYPTMRDAEHAMEYALLIESICEEDALDTYIEVTDEFGEEDDVYIIDQDNPDHTGIGRN